MPHFIFIQQISVLNILNVLYNLHFFSSKCRLFHNATLLGFCITHILNTGCAKIWQKVRRQKVKGCGRIVCRLMCSIIMKFCLQLPRKPQEAELWFKPEPLAEGTEFSAVYFVQFWITRTLGVDKKNILIYAVGSKRFRPDQLFKATEIKQICYFST